MSTDNTPCSQEWDGTDRRAIPDKHWHVGREVPIAFIVAILFQTAGGIWWAASLSSKIDNAIATISEFKSERYTKDDGRRDRELLMQIFEQQRQTDREHERRLNALEERAAGGTRLGPGITRPRSVE